MPPPRRRWRRRRRTVAPSIPSASRPARAEPANPDSSWKHRAYGMTPLSLRLPPLPSVNLRCLRSSVFILVSPRGEGAGGEDSRLLADAQDVGRIAAREQL